MRRERVRLRPPDPGDLVEEPLRLGKIPFWSYFLFVLVTDETNVNTPRGS
jgi:hypothetical protein